MAINKLDTRGYWKVGSSSIYTPSTPCQVEHTNITGSSTGRDESGVIHIDWVRRDIRKVYLKYNAMTGEELRYMRLLMQGKEYTFTFLEDNYTTTMNAYTGEMKYEHYTYSGKEKIYQNVSINVIEI